ncbi:MAG: OmpA family protein [Parafilimonas sp.]|nr:OmpA family protein [Parafilimonas sp.]
MKIQNYLFSAACVFVIQNLHAQTPDASVHFAFDKSEINTTDLASLQGFKAAHPNVESITIDGYADPVGTDDYNYALSMRRCNAVKQVLGYDESKTEVLLKVTAHGEQGLLFATNPENRVVLIEINDKKKVVVQPQIKQEEVKVVVQEPAPKPVDTVAQKPVIKDNAVADIAPSKPKELGLDKNALLQQLENAKIGESVVLTDIHFEEARHVLLKSSKPALNEMLDALKAMPTLQLEIQGHMCCGDELAQDGFDIDTKEFSLSYNRAKAVYDFMVQNGIDASRLTYKGFGTRKRLVSPEKTDDDRNENRRVEFLIVKK